MKALSLAVLAVVLAGCSVYMAANQPAAKNLDLLKVGTPRAELIAEFGQPAVSETKNGRRVDTFSFVQGYSTGAKVGRSLFHGVADVFTLGLWEVVGTPTEMVFSGDKVAFEVTYDAEDLVAEVKQLGTAKPKEKASPSPAPSGSK